MPTETFTWRSTVPAPAEFVFDWHTRPQALGRLTPPWEPVEVGEMSHGITEGSRGQILLKAGPFRKKWIAEIRSVQPGRQFQDVQISGPFASWVHTHRMIPDGERCCILEDRIEYQLPWGATGRLFGAGFVRRKLERLFAYRHRITREDVAALYQQSAKETKPMKILISGLSGMVGSSLGAFLTGGGHEVVGLSRNPGSTDIGWKPLEGEIDKHGLEGVDAVVHLAGENIAKRWTENQKRLIRDSRVKGTTLLCETLADMPSPPKVLVSASAIGYYGDRGDEILTESSPPAEGFLPEVCLEWEAACEPARNKGIRVVNLRMGVILSPEGGALAKMLLPFKMGVGGKVGSGSQYWSWIALDDVVGAIHHALMEQDLNGPVNATAPHPCTNYEFTKTLGKVLSRPTLFPMPKFAARLALGEMADDLLLASARVVPERLQKTGYSFRFPNLEDALRHLLGK
jgi:uncharacterized protein (TIGR01777 family)